jgi:hypothetical protein
MMPVSNQESHMREIITVSVHATYIGDRADPIIIRSVFQDRDGPVVRELDRLSLLVLNRARTLVGVRSGLLISTIRREQGHGPTGRYVDVIAGVSGLTSYLGWHHDGTPPHVIRPRRRKVLRFISGGRVVYARHVNHPGSRGTHFLTRALDAVR